MPNSNTFLAADTLNPGIVGSNRTKGRLEYLLVVYPNNYLIRELQHSVTHESENTYAQEGATLA